MGWRVSFYNKRNGQQVTVTETFGQSASKDDIDAVNEEITQYLRDHEWLPQNTAKQLGEHIKFGHETAAVPSSDVRFEATHVEE